MAQYDVHRNASDSASGDVPYLLDIQSDLLAQLQTRVVVPLIPADLYGKAISRLNPVFDIHGETCVGAFTELAGVPRSCLGDIVCSVSEQRDDITAAVDFLLQGF